MDDEQDREVGDVGYGKPPKATRWQKGQSGNPSGRREQVTEVLGLGEMAMRYMAETMPIKMGGKRIEMSHLDALIVHGYNLAIKAKRPIDVTRYLESLAKLGFQFPYASQVAREKQRESYDELLDEFDEHNLALGVELARAEAKMRKQDELIALLLAEPSGGKGPSTTSSEEAPPPPSPKIEAALRLSDSPTLRGRHLAIDPVGTASSTGTRLSGYEGDSTPVHPTRLIGGSSRAGRQRAAE